ncbi:hypothetical protein B0H14DRAFT_2319035, partial [Mycena olivaceomarginata]
TMSTARDSVISTPVLLELTLSHLPMRDLLVTAPLVNKTWLALTLTPTLQRALFFQPDPLSPPMQNPMLAEIFPPFFTPGPPNEIIWKWPAPDVFKREDASWQRMLIKQPPVQTLIIEAMFYGQLGSFHREAVVTDLSLRMGALYDLA